MEDIKAITAMIKTNRENTVELRKLNVRLSILLLLIAVPEALCVLVIALDIVSRQP